MEEKCNNLPSKKEYVNSVLSFLRNNQYTFEEERDMESSPIAMLYDGEESYQLSYETDELAPYLAIGKMKILSPEFIESQYLNLIDIANEINNEMIMVKIQVVREFGLYFYVTMPFPFINDLGGFIAYSIDAIETAILHYRNKV